MKGVIYCYHCIPTGKKYIGQTTNEKQRKSAHINRAKKGTNFLFYRAVRKYGCDNFIYGIIDYFEEHLLNENEVYFIEKYDTFNNGYNCTLGGEGSRGRVRTKEELKKQSERLKGKKKTKEHREKISQAHMGKIVGSLSDETKRKMSLSHQGKHCGQNNNFYGKKHNEELLKKWSEERKNVPYWNNGQIHKCSVECPGDGWVRGRIKSGKWWNNGKENRFEYECPGKDWKRGQITNQIYVFISPTNEEILVYSLTSFCLEYNLDRRTVLRLLKRQKKYQSHKGWKLKEIINL